MGVQFLDGGRFNKDTDAGNIVARYVHSGNVSIQPSALDKTTGLFTTTQSLNTLVGANGTIVSGIIPVNTDFSNGIIPREFIAANNHKLEVISDNTFYIQDTNTRIASYPNVNNTLVDVAKFSFELFQPASVVVNIAPYNLSEIAVRINGVRNRAGQTYVYLQGTHDGGTYDVAISSFLDGKEFHNIFLELYWKYNKENSMLFGQGIRSAQTYWVDTAGTWTVTGANDNGARLFGKYSNFKMTGIKLFFPMANNFTCDIYDMRGD